MGRARSTSLAIAIGVALAIAVLPGPTAALAGRTVERVSVATTGVQGKHGTSQAPAVSATGRYVAFASTARNLVPDDLGQSDVFVRDRLAGITERVSVASDGTPGVRDSMSPSISADGRYVAFVSASSTLVPADINGVWDIFVHDRETGQTERVSVASAGGESNMASDWPAISATGRYVAFSSVASNLVPGDTNDTWDVFVHDRQAETTRRISVASDGTEANLGSYEPSISRDGRQIAFDSHASNLVTHDTNGVGDVFVRDRSASTTQRVSVKSGGRQAYSPSYGHYGQAISGDGRYVVFASKAWGFVGGDTNKSRDIFVHDRNLGVTERVSLANDGSELPGPSSAAAISGDGRYVSFDSHPSRSPFSIPGTFRRDLQTGATERVDIAVDGTAPDGGTFGSSISRTGRTVAFTSSASNLVPWDTNGISDVFVRRFPPDPG